MKPWLTLNQLGHSFALTVVDVLNKEQKSPDFLAINPLGVVPFLVTDTGQGIGESNAMLWYLANDSHLMPKTHAEQAECLQWMFFEQSKLEPFIAPARFFTTILPQEKINRADDIAQWQRSARSGLAHLDAHLSGRQFMLMSGYSIADIAIFGYVHVLDEAGLSMDGFPNIAKWCDTIARTDRFVPLHTMGQPKSIAA